MPGRSKTGAAGTAATPPATVFFRQNRQQRLGHDQRLHRLDAADAPARSKTGPAGTVCDTAGDGSSSARTGSAGDSATTSDSTGRGAADAPACSKTGAAGTVWRHRRRRGFFRQNRQRLGHSQRLHRPDAADAPARSKTGAAGTVCDTAADVASSARTSGRPAGSATAGDAVRSATGADTADCGLRACNTSRSMARKPRTLARICTLAWLSRSNTGWARSRRKWLRQ